MVFVRRRLCLRRDGITPINRPDRLVRSPRLNKAGNVSTYTAGIFYCRIARVSPPYLKEECLAEGGRGGIIWKFQRSKSKFQLYTSPALQRPP